MGLDEGRDSPDYLHRYRGFDKSDHSKWNSMTIADQNSLRDHHRKRVQKVSDAGGASV